MSAVGGFRGGTDRRGPLMIVAGRWSSVIGERRERRRARRAHNDELLEAGLLPPAQPDPRD